MPFVRRERDSNPRNLAVHRFSRPAHSTTLPSLRLGLQFYVAFFLLAKKAGGFFSFFQK
jgi:hypothetical protein